MASLNTGFLSTLHAGIVPTFSDGVVAAVFTDGSSTLITSPNAEYIPQVEHGLLTVHLRDDGRFGLADPVNAPQIFLWKYPYLCAILRPVQDHDPLAALWKIPTKDDFIPNKGAVVCGFGRLSPAFLAPLDVLVAETMHRTGDMSSHTSGNAPAEQEADFRWYVVAMRRALDRLRYMSATFRDQVIQVAQLQRYWLLSNAYVEYQSRLHAASSGISPAADVAQGLMGAWSTDPKVVQHLMALGIPVWFLRAHHLIHGEVRIRSLLPILDAQHITSVPFFGEEPLYRGLAGDAHLEATMRRCDTYRDLSRTPAMSLFLSEDYCSGRTRSQTPKFDPQTDQTASTSGVQYSGSSQPSGLRFLVPRKIAAPGFVPYPKKKPGKPHPSQMRGRDKFAEFPHRWMPAAIPAWERAMQSVDRTEKARASDDIWGYWIPEPALLVSPTDPAKVERHILNWLRARISWLYLLWIPGSGATKVGTQAWRQFLNGLPEERTTESPTRRRRFEIREIFGGAFADADFAAQETGPIDWHEHSISQLSDDLAPKIVWEVFELGFRYELLAIDQFLRPKHTPRDRSLQEDLVARVFPEGVVHTVHSLPSRHATGLFATVAHRRINALNAFKDILIQWPGCPSIITQKDALRLSDPPSVIEEVEFKLACFYVNTFFQLSGRAPIVPHLFPV
ncbi:hypothetical protein LXA43DRAFT_937471 [Ganoderma leucocontextum]|nr:hypothetical protein LXA43DRAFT_937471 [Ganoderma leucocontextum]